MALAQRLEEYDVARRALLGELEALEPATLAAKPGAGEWSVLEIVEHLVLAERTVFRGLPDPSSLVAGVRGPMAHARYPSCLDALGPRGVRKAVFEHPVAGPLTVAQAIRLGRVHLERHIGQIRELERLSSVRDA